MRVLVVAAVSARLMAEAAAADGFEVIALDVFGDADTRRAAAQWHGIGNAAGGFAIDAVRTLDALLALAARGDVLGWVAGSGFEGRPALLEAGARVLPLLGTPADAVRRLRDPRTFFECLQRHGLAHPSVAWQRPVDVAGWLSKDGAGHGGWHIRAADGVVDGAPGVADRDADADGGADADLGTNVDPATGAGGDGPGAVDERWRYFQRLAPGVSMSATFIAAGGWLAVLGFNRLTVRPLGARPFVYHGAIGPLPGVPAGVAAQVERGLRRIAGEFGLRGLGSVDFLLDGDTVWWLEVNPRPPASIALYGGTVEGGPMAAHVRACRPAGTAGPPATWTPPRDVRGTRIVFSPRQLQLDAAAAGAISQWPGSHDWPAAGTRFAAGDPLCSISAAGADADAVERFLSDSRAGLLRAIGVAADDNDNRTETAR